MDPRLNDWLAREGSEEELESLLDDAARADLVRLERAARALPLLEPPAALSEAVLETIGHSPPRPANRTWILPLLALVAAALLVVFWPARTPSELVPRGPGVAIPEVGLSMSVQHDGRVARFRRGSPYPPGDTILFHAEAAPGSYLALVRIDAGGAKLLHAEQASAPATDLTTDGRPLGYELEPGEEASVFALLGTSEPLTSADALSVGPDPQRVCAAAHAAGMACAAERVEAPR